MIEIKMSDYADVRDDGKISFPLHKIEKLYLVLYQRGYRCVKLNKRWIYFMLKNDECHLVKYWSLKSVIYWHFREIQFVDHPEWSLNFLNAWHSARGTLNHDLILEYMEMRLADLSEPQLQSLKQAIRCGEYSSPAFL